MGVYECGEEWGEEWRWECMSVEVGVCECGGGGVEVRVYECGGRSGGGSV